MGPPRSRRPALLMLLAAALFVRAFVPQGAMPERTGNGTLVAMVCTAGGVHAIAIDLGEGEPREERRGEPPCAFAGLAAPALPSAPMAELAPPDLRETAFPGSLAAVAGPGSGARLPPATGPPPPA